MTPYEAYQMYCAIKLHFTDWNYDYVKYGGHVKATPSSFENRNDKFYFAKLAKYNDLEGYLVANFLQDNTAWVGDLASSLPHEQSYHQQIYREWLKRKESLTYIFKNDIAKLSERIVDEIKCVDGNTLLYTKYLRKEISPETIVIFNRCYPFFTLWDKWLKNNPLWSTDRLKLTKYERFIPHKEEFANIIKEKYKNNS